MCARTTVSPTGLAEQAVANWNALNWGYADVAGPWNELVEAFGEDEARALVSLVIRAQGRESDVGYAAWALEGIARRQNEERAARDEAS